MNEALENGFDEALMLDSEGFIAEGSGENFFLVKNGILYSPDLDSCLDGITRRTILDLAEQLNITFTVKRDDISKTKQILKESTSINYKEIISNEKVAKVSIVGAGMVSTPGVTYKMFRGLSDENINILAISTSEIKLSVIIDEENTLKAVKKLHTIFDLD